MVNSSFSQNILNIALGLAIFCMAFTASALDPIELGSHSASDGNITAIATLESYDGQDRNGDGDSRDRILTIHDISNNSTINTGIPIVGKLATDGTTVVFLYSERNQNTDLNGDGDTLDNVLAYYDIPTGQLHTTTIVPRLSSGQSSSLPYYDVDGNFITFVSKELLNTDDFNDDGDHNDTVVRYFDIENQHVNNTPLVAPYAMVNGGVIATRVTESQATDINGDGDTTDVVFVAYDIETEQLSPYLATPIFSLSNIASFPAKFREHYYFRARENQLGFDVDGNNNISSTTVLMHYNMRANTLNWTGVMATTGRIQAKGNYISYETSEWSVGQDINGDGDLQHDFLYAVHNLSDGNIQYLPKTGAVSLGYGVFSQTISESSRGDLNNDGDTRDTVVYAQRLDQSELIDIENCESDDIHCRFLNLQHYLNNHNGLSNAAKSTLIQLVLNADTILTQNYYDNEMERYIAVIAAFDSYFDTVWARNDLSQSVKEELTEQHPNARDLKDHLHDLKEAEAAMLDAEGNAANDSDEANTPEMLIAGMATAIENASTPQATKTAMMQEVNGIIHIAQQIMAGADASVLIGDVFSHVQSMRSMLEDSGNGFSTADIEQITSAIEQFEVLLNGG